MSIKRMHYDIKVKLNKVDSQQYRNLLIPEIQWLDLTPFPGLRELVLHRGEDHYL